MVFSGSNTIKQDKMEDSEMHVYMYIWTQTANTSQHIVFRPSTHIHTHVHKVCKNRLV